MSWLGTAFGLASAICWASANVSIKPASQRFGSWAALVWAQLIGGVVAVVVAIAIEGSPRDVVGAAVPLCIAGVAACAAYGGLFASLGRGQVSVVTPIISAWSLISVAVAVLQGGEALSTAGAIGVAMVVVGNIVVARSGSERGGATPPAAIGLAVISALGFGVMVPAIDHAQTIAGPLWTVPLVWAIELCIAVPILWKLGKLSNRPRSGRDFFIVGRAAIFEVGGFIAISLGLANAPVTVVSPVSSLSTAGTVALGLLLLRERVRPTTIVGAFVASAGVVMLNL